MSKITEPIFASMQQARQERISTLKHVQSVLGDRYLTNRPASYANLDVFRTSSPATSHADIDELNDLIEALAGPSASYLPSQAQVAKLRELEAGYFLAQPEQGAMIDHLVACIGALRSYAVRAHYPRGFFKEDDLSTHDPSSVVVRYLLQSQGEEQQLDDLSTAVWLHYAHGHGTGAPCTYLDLVNWVPARATRRLRLRLLLHVFDDSLYGTEHESLMLVDEQRGALGGAGDGCEGEEQRGWVDVFANLCLAYMCYAHAPELPGQGQTSKALGSISELHSGSAVGDGVRSEAEVAVTLAWATLAASVDVPNGGGVNASISSTSPSPGIYSQLQQQQQQQQQPEQLQQQQQSQSPTVVTVFVVFIASVIAWLYQPTLNEYRSYAASKPWEALTPWPAWRPLRLRWDPRGNAKELVLARITRVPEVIISTFVLKYIGCLPLWEPVELAAERGLAGFLYGPLRLGMGKHFSRYFSIEGYGFGHAPRRRPKDSLDQQALWPRELVSGGAQPMTQWEYRSLAVGKSWIVPLLGTTVSAPDSYGKVDPHVLPVVVQRLATTSIRVSLITDAQIDCSGSDSNSAGSSNSDNINSHDLHARINHDHQVFDVAMSPALRHLLNVADDDGRMAPHRAHIDADNSRAYALTWRPALWYGLLSLTHLLSEQTPHAVVFGLLALFAVLCSLLSTEEPGPSERYGWLNRDPPARRAIPLNLALHGAVMSLAMGTCTQLQSATTFVVSPVVRVEFTSVRGVWRQYRFHGADQGRPSIKVWTGINVWPNVHTVWIRVLGYFAHSIDDGGLMGFSTILTAVCLIGSTSAAAAAVEAHRGWIVLLALACHLLPCISPKAMFLYSTVWWICVLSLTSKLDVEKLVDAAQNLPQLNLLP
ncbi:hypothetical protein OC835_005211 [Tilletia horrida]|nr:hypothetical protein OC835_005211 [Tilletia horrida]